MARIDRGAGRWALACVAVCAVAATAPGQATFEFLLRDIRIGVRWEDGATLDSLSPDGTMVALEGTYAHGPPASTGFWSREDGEVTYLAPEASSAFVRGFCDGGVLIETYTDSPTLWSRGVGFTDVASVFPGFGPLSSAWSISADGSTLVGTRCVDGTCDSRVGVRWRRDGSVSVIEPQIGYEFATARLASGDGSVVTGDSEVDSAYAAWVWTEEEGRTDFAWGPDYSVLFAGPISEDGSTVVVYHWGPSVNYTPLRRAFLWTRDGGEREIGPAPAPPAPHDAFNDFAALAISSDGAKVLGIMRVIDDRGLDVYSTQFLWTEAMGMVDAREYLMGVVANPYEDEDYVVRIDEVIDMSADGKRFLVYGTYEYIGPPVPRDGRRDARSANWCHFSESCPAFVTLPSACAGDLDRDDDTDVSDFDEFVRHFGESVLRGTCGDLDWDGWVDVLDFGVLAGDFGCGGE